MKRIAHVVAALAIAACGLGVAHSRPLVIEESATLTPPPGITYVRFGEHVGTNGEYALVLGERPRTGAYEELVPFDALLYRRVSGNWVFQRILSQGSRDLSADWSYFPAIVGMKGHLASTILGETRADIFRFDGADWVPAGSGAGLQEDVSIDGERLLYGVAEGWDGRVYEPDGNGGWTSTFLPGQPRGGDDEFWGGPVDLLGTRAILGTPYTFDVEPQEIPIYERYPDSGWYLRTRLQVPAGASGLGDTVALHGDNAIVNAAHGPFIWNSADYFTTPTGRLQADNAYARGAATYLFAKDGRLLLASAFDPDLARTVINVFRPDAAGRYQHVAILKARSAGGLNGSLEIDGNTVIAGSNTRALVFELPTSLTAPRARHDRFEGGNGGNWTPSAGSRFSVVRPTRINGVYRQSSTAGSAHSLLNDTAWIHQAIEADIRPTAFDGVDRWVGLATRFSDARNYYYVTLRSSGSVQLKRMRAGAHVTLGTAPLAVRTQRTYRVRLESLGGTHRVYVDGVLRLSVEDAGPQVAGHAAVIMYRAAADFDNVVVTPSPRATLFADDFATPSTFRGDWTHSGPGQWSHAGGVLAQDSVAAEARAVIGTPAADQVVASRVRPMAFAASSSAQERWVGLIARHRDDRNYYYLTLRSGNSLSLRKLVDGIIVPIATVPLSVDPGSWYSLRLEVMVSTLRVWVGNTLVMQVLDSSHARGRVGLMTYKAAAQFDDFVAYRP